MFHISKSVKQDEMTHTTFEPALLNYRLLLSNCFKYISVGRVGRQNASFNYRNTKCEVTLFSCNTQCLYATTLCYLTFTNIYTSCTHPRKINYPCMLGIASTLSNLPRYLMLLSNYAENDEEADSKIQRASSIHLLLQKVKNVLTTSRGDQGFSDEW